jgi:hypothetical protein
MVQTKTGETLGKISSSFPLTLAKIVDLNDNSTFSLPPEFLETFKCETNNPQVIIIVLRSTKDIHIIPTKSNSVVKISIEIEDLSSRFLQDLGKFFMRFSIKTIYSTGLIFTPENCFYEAFIDSTDLSMPVDLLKDELKGIKGVSGVGVVTLVG